MICKDSFALMYQVLAKATNTQLYKSEESELWLADDSTLVSR